MKRILAFVLPMLVTITAFGQGKVEITSGKQTFVQNETSSVTQFTFTDADVKNLKEKAQDLKTRLTLEMDKNSDGTYACELNIKTQNHAEYVSKMLLTLGFENVTVDGTEKPVADLAADLNTMMNK